MLREYKKLAQRELFPGDDTKRSQVTNAEAGRNKFSGPFLRELAKAFGAPLDVFEAYLNGDVSLDGFLKGTELGIAGMGADYHSKKAREFEAKRATAAPTPRQRTLLVIDPLLVVKALNELDGVSYERAVATTQDVQLEAGDNFALYVAARLKLKAETGAKLRGEKVLRGPDVPTPKRGR